MAKLFIHSACGLITSCGMQTFVYMDFYGCIFLPASQLLFSVSPSAINFIKAGTITALIRLIPSVASTAPGRFQTLHKILWVEKSG